MDKTYFVVLLLKVLSIKHYFETVDHRVLVGILGRRIKDERVLWLVGKILGNFNGKIGGKGMPLGNYASQFFANVYLQSFPLIVLLFLGKLCLSLPVF